VSSLALRFRVAKSEASVVEALKEQDDVGKSVVDSKDDLEMISKTL